MGSKNRGSKVTKEKTAPPAKKGKKKKNKKSKKSKKK